MVFTQQVMSTGLRQAKHRPMPTHSSKQWELAVGGTRNTLRAIYGGNDETNRPNDPLCVVVATVKDSDTLRYATADIHRDTDAFSEVPAVNVDHLIQRAIATGKTIVEYCAMMDIQL